AKEFEAWLEKTPAKLPLAGWLQLAAGGRETEGIGARVTGIEGWSKVGEGRAIWGDDKGEELEALRPVRGNPKRGKIVRDPELLQLLTGRAQNIQDPPQLYA